MERRSCDKRGRLSHFLALRRAIRAFILGAIPSPRDKPGVRGTCGRPVGLAGRWSRPVPTSLRPAHYKSMQSALTSWLQRPSWRRWLRLPSWRRRLWHLLRTCHSPESSWDLHPTPESARQKRLAQAPPSPARFCPLAVGQCGKLLYENFNSLFIIVIIYRRSLGACKDSKQWRLSPLCPR